MIGIFPTRVLTLFLSESLLLFGCYLAAAYLDPDIEYPGIFLLYDYGLLRITVVVCVILLGIYLRGLYSRMRSRGRTLLFQELCAIFAVALMMQGLITYADRAWSIPRKVMLIGTLLALVIIFGWRLLFQSVAQDAFGSRRILFLGMTPVVAELTEHFRAHPELGLKPIGYLAGAENMAGAGLACLGSVAELNAVVASAAPNTIVIGRRGEVQPRSANEFLEFRFGGIHTEQAAILYERTFGRVSMKEIWPSKLIFADTWKTREGDLQIQTVYSAAIALAVLAITSPIFLLAASLVKLTSRGPALVRDARIGKQEGQFTMYTFRCTDSSDGSGRLTAIGRLLRRSGLDELPRLLNVLEGRMALVGPCPDRPGFAARLTEQIPFYRQRYQVKPGVIGWAEAHPDSEVARLDALRRLEYDLYYVKRFSPALDWFVLLQWLKTAWRPRATGA